MLFTSIRVAVAALLVHGLNAGSCQFNDGDVVTLLGDNGNWMARCNGCVPRASIPDSVFVHSPGNIAPPDFAKWKVFNTGDGKLAFQADTGKFIARCNGCAPTAASPDEAFLHVSDWRGAPYAQWSCEDVGGGKIALMADTGNYLARCNGCLGGAPYADSAFVHVKSWAGAPWAQWTVNNLTPRTTTALPTTTPTPTTTQAPIVTLWAADYKGASRTFGLGSYNLDGDLLNSLSSLQVAPGYLVILFDQPNQQGNSIIYSQDVPWPTIGSWNDRAQSIRVLPSSTVLTVWRDDYQGVFSNFYLGAFNLTGDFLNSISSLKLSPGYMVTVFDRPGLTGNNITYKNDVPYTAIGSWNDKAQSIIVDRIPTTWAPWTPFPSTTPQTTTPAPTTTSFVPPVVTLWAADYKGASQSLGLGFYNLQGDLLNTLSSLNISAGYQITLFDQPNQRGNNITYGVDVPWPQIGGWNDRAQSIWVAPSSVVLTVYTDDYKGSVQSFGVGKYYLQGDLVNSLSSLKLADNFQVTLYDQPNQGGNSMSFTTDLPFPAIGTLWNDKAQSINVEKLRGRCGY
ncbi:unnamed protein product [Aphanomyces euteiches]